MSFWGEAMSRKQGLWETEQYNEGRQALADLDALPGYQVTEKERMFIDATRVLFGNGSAAERDQAYAQAMRGLYDRFPTDPEVATFYVLAVLSTIGTERGMLERGGQALRDADSILQTVLK